MSRRLFFAFAYLLGRPPWDTNITPPELVKLIETERPISGRALELGCGTGTNAVYLARHGWQVTGIDFSGQAIRRARRKARQAGVEERTQFLVADVSQMGALDGLSGCDLFLDIGCLHSLSPEQRISYAEGLASLAKPGAIFLLYAFQPREGRTGPMGLTPDEVHTLFAPGFRVLHVEHGLNESNQSASAWYRLERVA